MREVVPAVVALVISIARVGVALLVVSVAGWLVRSLIRPTTDASRFEEIITLLALGFAALPGLGLVVFVVGLPFNRVTVVGSLCSLGATCAFVREIRRRRGTVFPGLDAVRFGRRILAVRGHLSIPAMLVLFAAPVAAIGIGVARAVLPNPPDAPFIALGFDGAASFSNRAILLTPNSALQYPVFVSETGTKGGRIHLMMSIGDRTVASKTVVVAPNVVWHGVLKARVPADLVCGDSGFSVDIFVTDESGTELGPRISLPVIGCR